MTRAGDSEGPGVRYLWERHRHLHYKIITVSGSVSVRQGQVRSKQLIKLEKFGGGEWTRTTDLRIMRPSL
jgi:hypothetical protein